jgi:glycosyltransferase involved in cell wall biosynthesis
VIRILYVLPSLAVGGAERSLLALLRRLDRARFEPHLCSLMDAGPESLRPCFEELGVPVHALGVGPGLAELQGARIFSLVRRLRPQLVHSRLVLANAWARLAGALSGAAVICEERNLDLERPLVANLLNWSTQRLATVQLANAAAIGDLMRARDHVDPRKLRVVQGGIDLAPFEAVPAASPEPDHQLVSVHRLVPYKGTRGLLEALALVRAARPAADVRLLLVGDGPARSALEKQARAPGLAGAVTFAGQRDDLPSQLARGRIFTLLSHDEGTPNAVLEGMAAGLPVVATAVAGTAEVVEEGVTGRLVPPRAPQAAAQALLKYLDDPAHARAHGAAGRARVHERYSIEKVVQVYQELYLELAKQESR